MTAQALAQSKPDRFYLPHLGKPSDGKVDTRISTLDFNNQYQATNRESA